MTTPEFIVELRKHIGHAPLWIPGVTAVALRVAPGSMDPHDLEVLLVRRADNGQWTPVTGIIDPNEHPHSAAIREIHEEAGLDAEVVGVLGASAVGPVIFPNGDECSFSDIALAMRIEGDDTPTVGDDESLEVSWHSVSDLPSMQHRFPLLIDAAVRRHLNPARFQPLFGYGDK